MGFIEQLSYLEVPTLYEQQVIVGHKSTDIIRIIGVNMKHPRNWEFTTQKSGLDTGRTR